MKIILSIFLLIVFNTLAFSQDESKRVNISFHPIFGNKAFILNTTYYTQNNKDSFFFQTLRFYISDIKFYNNNKLIWKETGSCHLIDAEEPSTLSIALKDFSTLKYNRLQFNLGIDSLTNAAGAGSEELDAVKGMYWAWQSGYINFKLEGTHSLCKTRKNAFQFHLGGFRNEDYCMQQISLPVTGSDTINVTADVSKFINNIDISKQNTIMTPGKEAVILSQKVSTIFSIKTSM